MVDNTQHKETAESDAPAQQRRRFNRAAARDAEEQATREAQLGRMFSRYLFDSSTLPSEMQEVVERAAPAYLGPGQTHNFYDLLKPTVEGPQGRVFTRGVGRDMRRLTDPADLDAYLTKVPHSPAPPREMAGTIGRLFNFVSQRPEFAAIDKQVVEGLVRVSPDAQGNLVSRPITVGELFQPNALTQGLASNEALHVTDAAKLQASYNAAMDKFLAVSKYDQNLMKTVRWIKLAGISAVIGAATAAGIKIFGWGSDIASGVREQTGGGAPAAVPGAPGATPTQNLINQGIDASPRYQQQQYQTTPLQDLNRIQSQTGGAGFGPFQRQDWQLRNQRADYAQHGIYNAYDALLQDDMQQMRSDYLPPTAGTMAAYPSLYRGASTTESEEFFRRLAAERRAESAEEESTREAQIADGGVAPSAPAAPQEALEAPFQEAQIDPQQVERLLDGIPSEDTLLAAMNQLAQQVTAAYGTLDSVQAQSALAQGFQQIPGVREAMELWAQMAPRMGIH